MDALDVVGCFEKENEDEDELEDDFKDDLEEKRLMRNKGAKKYIIIQLLIMNYDEDPPIEVCTTYPNMAELKFALF